MGEQLKSQRLFTVAELLKKDVILETPDACEDSEEDDNELFGFSRDRNITCDEMLKYLNIGDEDDDEDGNNDSDDDNYDSAKIIPCGISFEKLKETMTDISGDGKVFKSVKRAGVGDLPPKDGKIYIHYMGYFEYQDEPFDSSYLRQKQQEIRLNHDFLIEGLRMGILTMRKHEIAHFIIHPDYAYGALGCPPRLPPNEEVMFAVYLTNFVDNAEADTYENLNTEERKSMDKAFPKAMAFHATANDDFKRNRIRQAVRGYSKVVAILEKIQLENEEEQIKQQKALSKALVNLGVCHNKLKEPRKTCTACRSVPVPNAKAHFTHAKALMMMGEYDHAMFELHEAKKLEPHNFGIVKEIRELNERIRKYRTEEKQLWSKCIKVKKGEKEITEYDKVAREICEKLCNDPDLLRQNLPPGLDDRELECFRQQAAVLGLSFTKHERYGNVEFYISKPNYETKKRF